MDENVFFFLKFRTCCFGREIVTAVDDELVADNEAPMVLYSAPEIRNNRIQNTVNNDADDMNRLSMMSRSQMGQSLPHLNSIENIVNEYQNVPTTLSTTLPRRPILKPCLSSGANAPTAYGNEETYDNIMMARQIRTKSDATQQLLNRSARLLAEMDSQYAEIQKPPVQGVTFEDERNQRILKPTAYYQCMNCRANFTADNSMSSMHGNKELRYHEPSIPPAKPAFPGPPGRRYL